MKPQISIGNNVGTSIGGGDAPKTVKENFKKVLEQ
jgi:hypothetical protein